MSELVRYETRERIAFVTLAAPPVNALSPGVLAEIDDAVDRANADPSVASIALVGSGRMFSAGADLNALAPLRARDRLLEHLGGVHARLRHIEDSPKPVVAVLNGDALGGGLELAMACHYRVAAARARVGQPEVLLGFIPGAGGTQRLPRLCGIATALEMCTRGKPMDAARALREGIVDQVIEGDLPHPAMVRAVEALSSQPRRTRTLAHVLRNAPEGRAACDEIRAALTASRGHVDAALTATEAIEAVLTMDFDAGSALERELFARCALSTGSRALVHVFLAEKSAGRLPDVPRHLPPRDIQRAGVVGAGTMGTGIAMAFANAGIPVLLKDHDVASLHRGMAAIRRRYDSSVASGKMTNDAATDALARITETTSYDAFGHLDVVVEAVFEDIDLKTSVFAQLAQVTSPECILASNTSTLDIDVIAEASGRPEQVVGHHFFSPANVMKLLEIVRGARTSSAVVADSLALGRRLDKVCVVVGNCFGFVANRMLMHYMREAYLLLEEGGSVSQIDQALVDFGMPVGPFGMQDIVGLDVGARIRRDLRSSGKTMVEGPQSQVPDRLYELGRLGQKTHCGWYRYDPVNRAKTADPMIEAIAADAAAARGVIRRAIADDEIVSRTMTALANEGARVLGDGYASRPSDIDVIYCCGFGFPRHRGGPLFYADTLGVGVVLDRVRAYREQCGDHWQPAPLLERLVAEGREFY